MNKPEKPPLDQERLSRPVFVSYATADRKEALSVCKAIERRGVQCWISCRDVAPGENYQEAIVAAIQAAHAMVLVFSEAANNSNEIKKELSLASRFGVTVIALRIEDVEPSNAFAYELSTRQWIDAFEGWDKAIDSLAGRLPQINGSHTPPGEARPHHHARRARMPLLHGRTLALAGSIAALVILAIAAWFFLRPPAAAAHSMQVRLTGFERLSPDLPSTMPDAIRDEIISAFNDDGVVGASTAAAAPPGTAPAYALGGTIRHDGDKIRVVARLTDERSGATLWSNSFAYDAANEQKVPRWLAIDAGNLVRCGLFGASTYRKTLADPVLADYLSYCHNDGYVEDNPEKAIYFGHKVVTSLPDFSWGWSAVAMASADAINELAPANSQQLRQEGLQAAATALRLDPSNSEALTYESVLTDPMDLGRREALLRQALKARPLACGCEHHYLGLMLEDVGRESDALAEYYSAAAVQALNPWPQFSLGLSLLALGKPDEAKPHVESAIDLIHQPWWRGRVALETAPFSGDYSAAAAAVGDPTIPMPPQLRVALSSAFGAMLSGNPAAKSAAAAQLAAIPAAKTGRLIVGMLGALGANATALDRVEAAAAAGRFGARGSLFMPTMDGARRDPRFADVAQRLGLMKYWKATHARPDACAAKDPPPFCRMI